jgi:hypothetical protein
MKKHRLEDIEKRAFDYFMAHTNLKEDSPGYGLTLDSNRKRGVASIAASGFMLSGLVLGVEAKYIDYDTALKIVIKTLETYELRADHFRGFFSHYLDYDTAKRYRKSEYSTIDTALLLNGMMTVDRYFDDVRVHERFARIIGRIDFDAFLSVNKDRRVLSMSYNPDQDGDYVEGRAGFISQWDMFAEQIMLYVIIAGLGKPYARKLYDGFERTYGTYQDIRYVYTPGNALFVYQFPLAWFDLQGIYDEDGISWFENAQQAIMAHRALSIELSTTYPTFSPYTFGFTASDTKEGYRVYSGLPNVNDKVETDGTVSPMAVVGSLPFIPEVAIEGIERMKAIAGLWGRYGFQDAYNMTGKAWTSDKILSIDKGLEMLMTNAYLKGDVYAAYMDHPIIKEGMEVLKWKKR